MIVTAINHVMLECLLASCPSVSHLENRTGTLYASQGPSGSNVLFCGFSLLITSSCSLRKDHYNVLHWTEADPSLASKQNTDHMPGTGDSGENRHDL